MCVYPNVSYLKFHSHAEELNDREISLFMEKLSNVIDLSKLTSLTFDLHSNHPVSRSVTALYLCNIGSVNIKLLTILADIFVRIDCLWLHFARLDDMYIILSLLLRRMREHLKVSRIDDISNQLQLKAFNIWLNDYIHLSGLETDFETDVQDYITLRMAIGEPDNGIFD
ncbi:unnamed protein product [Didymodactylos carnosus]|uniref:Uncharacterized protein n=1 Tax=Didymodactylos carnosus TaxID=1234261 RepID=A0A815AY00_9BILA|nr:unnamed protein product [Didymodactylos carnosus]CAF1262740.1 unnamed protein product [Didymodactylos carnosus]CAF4034175.1 unnamed protein product [Didymodactylos carnosus]CAF4042171.1 unnamed protein product [Didymodactylos carnosus]